MTDELTTADRFELLKATYDGQLTNEPRESDATIDRWQKYGKDRLYFNGLRTGDGYLDLKTGESGGDKWTQVSAEYKLEGDILTVKIGNMVSLRDFDDKDATYTFEIRVHGDGFEPEETHECDECGDDFETAHGLAVHEGLKHTDEDDASDETAAATSSTADAEAVADGGDDETDHLSDDHIFAAIRQYDDPERDDALTIADARTLLADIQQSLLDYWPEHLNAIDAGDESIVYEDQSVIVLADHTGRGWHEEFDAAGVKDDVTRTVLKMIHAQVARDLADEYDWSASDAFVVRKPREWRVAEQHVRRSIAKLARESGDADAGNSSVARGTDRWATERQALSGAEWGNDQTGTARNRRAASRNARRGREEAAKRGE